MSNSSGRNSEPDEQEQGGVASKRELLEGVLRLVEEQLLKLRLADEIPADWSSIQRKYLNENLMILKTMQAKYQQMLEELDE